MKIFLVLLILSTQLFSSQSPFVDQLPAEIYDFGVEQVGSVIYFVGGRGSSNWTAVDTVFTYDLITNQYSTLPSMSINRYDPAVLFNGNNRIYVVWTQRKLGNWIYWRIWSWYKSMVYNISGQDKTYDGYDEIVEIFTVCNSKIYSVSIIDFLVYLI